MGDILSQEEIDEIIGLHENTGRKLSVATERIAKLERQLETANEAVRVQVKAVETAEREWDEAGRIPMSDMTPSQMLTQLEKASIESRKFKAFIAGDYDREIADKDKIILSQRAALKKCERYKESQLTPFPMSEVRKAISGSTELAEQHDAEVRVNGACELLIKCGFSTGHGDSMEDVVEELKDQMAEVKKPLEEPIITIIPQPREEADE